MTGYHLWRSVFGLFLKLICLEQKFENRRSLMMTGIILSILCPVISYVRINKC